MISSLKRLIRVVELGTQFLRVSSTASQAGETDQTTHILSPANPEFCQLASPATTSGEEEPICTQHPNRSSADPKRRVPKRPNRHKPSSKSTSNRSSQRSNGTSNIQQDCNLPLQIHRNRETKWPAPENFDIDSVFQQCNRNWKQHQNPQNFPTKPQDDDQNEWSKLQSNRQLHRHIEFFNLTSRRASNNGSSQA